MGMTSCQLRLVQAVAENKMEEARKAAIACCAEDKTKKNEYKVKRYHNMLLNKSSLIELPANISSMAILEDLSNYRDDRYYLSKSEEELLIKIKKMRDAGIKLMELQIPYLNAILLTGQSGTGKTAFGRYVAKKLDLPFLYLNFSYLIDSYMGQTGKNLRNVFNFVRQNQCLLMLDEIDCIAYSRSGNTDSAGKEIKNVTITLLQELDQMQNDSLILAATNVPENIDPAVMRRFSIKHEIKAFEEDEMVAMLEHYLKTLPFTYKESEIYTLSTICCGKPQGIVINKLIEAAAEAVITGSSKLSLIGGGENQK